VIIHPDGHRFAKHLFSTTIYQLTLVDKASSLVDKTHKRPRDHPSTSHLYSRLKLTMNSMSNRSQTSSDFSAEYILNLAQLNRKKKKRRAYKENDGCFPSFHEQGGGGFEKTNTELFPFLAAISVQGEGLETGPNWLAHGSQWSPRI
jgi:hypothetical protein